MWIICESFAIIFNHILFPDLRPRSLSVGADTSTKHRELKLDSSQRKRKSFKNFKLLSPILKRSKNLSITPLLGQETDRAVFYKAWV